MDHPLAEDLDRILDQTRPLWEELRGERIFITGGTGFFGCWLVESFAWANRRLGLKAQATILSRRPGVLETKMPQLAGAADIQTIAGDVRTFAFPPGCFSHIIHAATESSVRLNDEAPAEMFDTIVEGTRRTLEFADRCGAKRFLFTSSGAVYGRQPDNLTHVPEDYQGTVDPSAPRSAYAEGKRAAETLCSTRADSGGPRIVTARGFAFVGPHLPLDAHFAVGNFIRDALRGGPINVRSDGTALRSYLYAADLAIWLWTILLRGKAGRAYNVGSDRAVTISELAGIVADAFVPRPEIVIAERPDPQRPADRYVPSVERASRELGLRRTVELPEAIERTVNWLRAERQK